MHQEHHGFLYGIIAALSSAGTALFVKLSSSVSVSTLVFSRLAFGVPFMLWVIYYKKIDITWKKVPKNLTRNLGGLLALYSYFYAVQALPLVNAVTLNNTTPLFFPLLVLIWMKLIVSKRRFLATGLGFLGVVVLLHPTTGGFLSTGSVLGLVSGLFGAIALISVRILSKSESTETILSYYYLVGAFLSFFPMLFNWEPVAEPIQWVYVLLAALCGLVYQFTLTKAYTHAPATKVGTTNYLSVVFSGLLGWSIFNEVPDLWVLAGTILIICGAFMALFDKTPPRPLNSSK